MSITPNDVYSARSPEDLLARTKIPLARPEPPELGRRREHDADRGPAARRGRVRGKDQPMKRPSSPNRAVGYIRVSTARQAQHGISLEHQQDMIRAYCGAHGLELVELVVDDGRSAYKQPLHRRAAGRRLVELVQSGEVGAVVALRLDRLFRGIQDAINTVLAWSKRGVALRLLEFYGQAVDTSTPMGRMLLTMMAGFAEMESFAKAERARDAWDYKRSRGQRLGSLPPFGSRVDADGLVVEDSAEQAALALIREMDSAGAGASAIRRALIDGGHQPRGKAWHLKTIDRILAREAEEAAA